MTRVNGFVLKFENVKLFEKVDKSGENLTSTAPFRRKDEFEDGLAAARFSQNGDEAAILLLRRDSNPVEGRLD